MTRPVRGECKRKASSLSSCRVASPGRERRPTASQVPSLGDQSLLAPERTRAMAPPTQQSGRYVTALSRTAAVCCAGELAQQLSAHHIADAWITSIFIDTNRQSQRAHFRVTCLGNHNEACQRSASLRTGINVVLTRDWLFHRVASI
jgi:hypothetical protein